MATAHRLAGSGQRTLRGATRWVHRRACAIVSPSMSTTLAGVRDWLRRARGLLRPADLAQLSPAGVLLTMAGYLREGRPALPRADLDARDPDLVRLAVDLFRAIGRVYFRYEVRGVEHVPAEGPALLVGNHNGGPLPTDTFLTLVALWDRFGDGRPVHTLAHDLLFYNRVTRRYAQGLGVLRASRQDAAAALRAGRLVLVYPGSDIDGSRPFSRRHRVELGGRRGFVRLALRSQAPIVPVVSAGTHEQFIVLRRGDRVARWLGGQRRLRVAVFPVVLSLPWGLTSGFFPYLPLPAQTTVAFGAPIRFPGLGPEAADDPDAVAACYRMVEERMQALLDELHRGRRLLLGQPRRR